MITKFFFDQTIGLIAWILSVGGGTLRLPEEAVDAAVWLCNYFFNDVAEVFFFFVRPSTFWIVMDFLFLYWAYKPIQYIKEWVLKKIPFAGFN